VKCAKGFCIKGHDIKFRKEQEKYLKSLSPDGKKFIERKASNQVILESIKLT